MYDDMGRLKKKYRKKQTKGDEGSDTVGEAFYL
jgi:hypothetical protein